MADTASLSHEQARDDTDSSRGGRRIVVPEVPAGWKAKQGGLRTDDGE